MKRSKNLVRKRLSAAAKANSVRWKQSLDTSRRKLVPVAHAQGICTDDDVFRTVS